MPPLRIIEQATKNLAENPSQLKSFGNRKEENKKEELLLFDDIPSQNIQENQNNEHANLNLLNEIFTNTAPVNQQPQQQQVKII